MKRREFLKTSAALAALAGSASLLKAGNTAKEVSHAPEAEDAGGPLIASHPVLQNYAPTSMGVAFAVSALAAGYVLYGRKPDLSDAVKVKCGGFRAIDIDNRIIQVRLTGLKPSTQYYYRIGADRIHYGGGYDMKVIGNEEDSRIYSFKTAGPKSKAHFCVINDTHVLWGPFGRAIDKIAQLNPSCVVWNGDASNTEETVDAQVRIYFKPEISRPDYASNTPYLFCPGNHDQRGMANRHLEHAWMFRQPEERLSRDWDLGRNFAIRCGEVAMIGLDTGEDKLDGNPKFAGLFNNTAYREAQTKWLADVLKRRDIRRARYIVAFCHIPLFDPDPEANPGDLAPADSAPGYKKNYAAWQRTCAQMWGPLLAKAKCQLVITGHQHRYRYDAPTPERPWAQIVGGGPHILPDAPDEHYATVIEGKVTRGRLAIMVHNLRTGTIQETLVFKPR